MSQTAEFLASNTEDDHYSMTGGVLQRCLNQLVYNLEEILRFLQEIWRFKQEILRFIQEILSFFTGDIEIYTGDIEIYTGDVEIYIYRGYCAILEFENMMSELDPEQYLVGSKTQYLA